MLEKTILLLVRYDRDGDLVHRVYSSTDEEMLNVIIMQEFSGDPCNVFTVDDVDYEVVQIDSSIGMKPERLLDISKKVYYEDAVKNYEEFTKVLQKKILAKSTLGDEIKDLQSIVDQFKAVMDRYAPKK